MLRQSRVFRALGSAALPVLLATLIVAGICILTEPMYSGNDDVGIAMVGAGFGEAAHPEPHLVWCHYGYGLILGMLSRLIGPNAHGWMTIGAIWLCLVLLIGATFRTQNGLLRWAILLVSLGTIYLVALLTAEFTMTAGVLFGAAIANWLTHDGPKGKRLFAVPILFALVLSYLIRPEAYEMGLVIVVPGILLLCWRHRNKLVLRASLMALSFTLILFFGFISDKIAYSNSPQWRLVPEYIDFRSQFCDFGRVPWRPEAPEYKQVGWTGNDYWMFGESYTRNPIYSYENLSLLVHRLAVPQTAKALQQLKDWFGYPLTDWPLLLNLVAQIVFLLVLNRDHRMIGLLFLAGEVVAITYAAFTGKEAYISSQIWYTASAITLNCLCALLISVPAFKGSFVRNAGLVLAGILGIGAGSVAWCQNLDVLRQASAYRNWVNQNRDYFKGKVTIWEDGICWEWLVTPTRTYFPFPELKVAAIDDLNCMPVETDMLSELGIGDLAKDICTDPAMILICPTRLLPVLIRFCEEHYGFSPIFKERAHWEGTAIYKLDSSSPSKTTSNP